MRKFLSFAFAVFRQLGLDTNLDEARAVSS
jgi:hypothetical protein